MAIKIELDLYGYGEWVELDYSEGTYPVALEKSSVDLTNLSKRAGEFMYSIDIPRTSNNDRAFNFITELGKPNKFNKTENYKMRISSNGIIIANGDFKLDGYDGQSINGSLAGDNIAWFDALNGKSIRDLDLGELEFTGDESIITYYSGRTDICWPLVSWAGFENRASQDSAYVYGSHKTSPRYTYKNFKPAVYVKHIFKQALAEAGIGVSGTFLESEQFKNLIILYGGDETYLPWKNLTDAKFGNRLSLNVNINEEAEGQIYDASKTFTDSSIKPIVSYVCQEMSHLYIIEPQRAGNFYLETVIGGSRIGIGQGITGIYTFQKLWRWFGSSWVDISGPVATGNRFYVVNNIAEEAQSNKYLVKTDNGIEVYTPALADQGIVITRGAYSIIRDFDIVNDPGKNASNVKQGTFSTAGGFGNSTLTASDAYQGRDFKKGDLLKTVGGNLISVNPTNDYITGPWSIFKLGNFDITNENVWRVENGYNVPVDGSYDISLGYGQFWSTYGNGDTNLNPQISYLAGSNLNGINIINCNNTHIVCAIKNIESIGSDNLLSEMFDFLKGLNPITYEVAADARPNFLLAYKVMRGYSTTVYDTGWQEDFKDQELFYGDKVSLVHFGWATGAFVIGPGYQDVYTGVLAGENSFDYMGIRLTEDTIQKTQTINGIATQTTIKPQVLNGISGEEEEGYTKLRIRKILPDVSCQDFIKAIMNIYNLYFVYDSGTKGLNLVPFNNYYLGDDYALELDGLVSKESEAVSILEGIPGVSFKYIDDTADEFQVYTPEMGAYGELKGTTNSIYLQKEKAEIKVPFSNTAGAGFVFWPGLETYSIYSAMYTQAESAIEQNRFDNFYGYEPRIVSLVDFETLSTSQSIGIDRPYIYINAVRYPVRQGRFIPDLFPSKILNNNYSTVYNLFGAKEKWDINIFIDEITWRNLRLDTPLRYKGQIFFPIKIGPWIPGRTGLTRLSMVKKY